MKVLLINGSPRHSCTYTALAEMQKVFEEFGLPAPPVRVKTNYIR